MSRMSNIPTVWSNCVVGICAYGFMSYSLIGISVICSLFYIAGMILNDVCDSKIDSIERPERPIPSQKIKQSEAILIVTILFALSIFFSGYIFYPLIDFLHISVPLLLLFVIILYNFWHKGNYFSPFIMASCRFLVYILSALIVTNNFNNIICIALVSASYIVGLTYLAMQENLSKLKNIWPVVFLSAPFIYAFFHFADVYIMVLCSVWAVTNVIALYKRDIKRGICGFIAGICLVDAMLLSTCLPCGLPIYLCLIFFVTTIIAQNFVSGT